MITGEEYTGLLVIIIENKEISDDSLKTIFGEYVIEHIVRRDVIIRDRVTCPTGSAGTVRALVERHKYSAHAVQLRGHLNRVVVNGEHYKTALVELEEELRLVTIPAELFLSIPSILSGEVVLKLDSHQWYSVDEKDDVDRLTFGIPGVMELSGAEEQVLFVVAHRFYICLILWLEVHRTEFCA